MYTILYEVVSVPHQKSEFYLFPLTNVNLFPSTTKPLQIFEERYIQMIQDSISKKIAIAICFVPEGSQEIRPIAGYGFPQIIETKPDGTLIIFISCVGKALLDLQNLKSVEPYLVAEGKHITELHDVDAQHTDQLLKLSQVLVRWIKKHVQNQAQQDIFLKSLIGSKEIVSAFAAYLVTDYDLQYELIQMHSINKQIEFIYRLLKSGELTNK